MVVHEDGGVEKYDGINAFNFIDEIIAKLQPSNEDNLIQPQMIQPQIQPQMIQPQMMQPQIMQQQMQPQMMQPQMQPQMMQPQMMQPQIPSQIPQQMMSPQIPQQMLTPQMMQPQISPQMQPLQIPQPQIPLHESNNLEQIPPKPKKIKKITSIDDIETEDEDEEEVVVKKKKIKKPVIEQLEEYKFKNKPVSIRSGPGNYEITEEFGEITENERPNDINITKAIKKDTAGIKKNDLMSSALAMQKSREQEDVGGKPSLGIPPFQER